MAARSQPGYVKPGVSRDDDPIFDADHAACAPNTRERRASVTVADVDASYRLQEARRAGGTR